MSVNIDYKFDFGDYCVCKRCPCCGKLVTSPFTTPIVPNPMPITPYPGPFPYTPGPIWYGTTTVPADNIAPPSTTTAVPLPGVKLPDDKK